jgi:hypothetical protein
MSTKQTGTIRALAIISEHAGESLGPQRFAHHYFPKDHPGWKRIGKCGAHGSRRGSGLVLWAGGFLGKLRAAGLIDWWNRSGEYGASRKCYLTKAGRDLLANAAERTSST